VEEAGGFDSQLADIEEVMAYRGDNHELLVQQFFRTDRPTMLALAAALKFGATSQDRSRIRSRPAGDPPGPAVPSYAPRPCFARGLPARSGRSGE